MAEDARSKVIEGIRKRREAKRRLTGRVRLSQAEEAKQRAAARASNAASTPAPVAAAISTALPRRPGQLPFIPPGKDTTPKVGTAKKPVTPMAPAKTSKLAAQVKSKPIELPAAQLQAEARERRRTKIGDEGRANRANPVKTPTHEHYAGRGYTPRTGRNKTTAELQRDRRK